MSAGVSNRAENVFGRLQGYGQATPNHAFTRTSSTPMSYASPQPFKYEDVAGNAFQDSGALHDEPGETLSVVTPVKGTRFLSAAIDFVFLGFVTIVIMVIYVLIYYMNGNEGSLLTKTKGMPLLLNLITLGVWYGYGLVMECSKYQGTVGKIITGTVVVNEDGSALSFGQLIIRSFGKFLSASTPFCISYFMVFFTKKNQVLHDKMCRSVVCKKSDLLKLNRPIFD